MSEINQLEALRQDGRARWLGAEQAWVARPQEIVDALAHAGFEEYKREEARSRRDREPSGGVWQGIDPRTGVVASAIWVNRTTTSEATELLIFVAIDGEPVRGA